MTALSPRRTFSGTALKTIACITMLVDHIGASCIEAGILTPGLDAGTLSQDTLSAYPLYRLDMVLRFHQAGLAFPLFCFFFCGGLCTHPQRQRLPWAGGAVRPLSEVPWILRSSAPPLTRVHRIVTGRWRWAYWLLAGLKRFERKTACPAGRGPGGRLCRAGAGRLPTTTPSVIIICALCLTPRRRPVAVRLWARCCCLFEPPAPLGLCAGLFSIPRSAVHCCKKAFYWFYLVHLHWCWQVSRTCCFKFQFSWLTALQDETIMPTVAGHIRRKDFFNFGVLKGNPFFPENATKRKIPRSFTKLRRDFLGGVGGI